MELEAVQKSYARWAHVYDNSFGVVTQTGRRRAVAVINRGSGSVLEVGVGTGLALPLYRPHLEVTGIDFSRDMLAKAQRRVDEEKLTHVKELRQMDARKLDFPDDHFDTVAAMHVLSVVPDPQQVMAEIARVTRPGGRVVISNHFSSGAGVMGWIEKNSASLANLLGWHPDFELETILQEPDLVIEDRRRLPPMGMMTLLVLTKIDN